MLVEVFGFLSWADSGVITNRKNNTKSIRGVRAITIVNRGSGTYTGGGVFISFHPFLIGLLNKIMEILAQNR